MSKDTAERNKAIYEKHKRGASFSKLAEEYDISNTRVSQIYKKIDWQEKHAGYKTIRQYGDKLLDLEERVTRLRLLYDIEIQGGQIKLTRDHINALFYKEPGNASRVRQAIIVLIHKYGPLKADEILNRLTTIPGIGIKCYNTAFNKFKEAGLI